MNSHCRKHRREQRRLILAVAVSIAEDVVRKVRLIASNPHLYDKVSNLLLNELGDGFRLIVKVGLTGSELMGFRRDLWGRCESITGELVIPDPDTLPAIADRR